MNVMGKILVVLNLLFALAVGAFLVIDFGLRKDWKAAYEELNNQVVVVKANTEGMAKTNQNLSEQLQKSEQRVTDLAKKLTDAEKKQTDTNATIPTMTASNNFQLNEAMLQLKTAQLQTKQLGDENVKLKSTIGDYSTLIAKLQEESKEEFQKRIQAENGLQTALDRNNFLLAELQKLYKDVARNKVDPKGGTTDVAVLKDPGAPNPPAVTVNSKIIEVGTSGDMVRLDTGSDSGLKKGHTLDVYRTAPSRQYLGMIRIVDVGPLEAIAQRVTTGPYASRELIQVNDMVISDVQRNP
jgi:hypothetical protein